MVSWSIGPFGPEPRDKIYESSCTPFLPPPIFHLNQHHQFTCKLAKKWPERAKTTRKNCTQICLSMKPETSSPRRSKTIIDTLWRTYRNCQDYLSWLCAVMHAVHCSILYFLVQWHYVRHTRNIRPYGSRIVACAAGWVVIGGL